MGRVSSASLTHPTSCTSLQSLAELGGKLVTPRGRLLSLLHPLQKHSPCWQRDFGLRAVSLSSAGSVQAEAQAAVPKHGREQTKELRLCVRVPCGAFPLSAVPRGLPAAWKTFWVFSPPCIKIIE